MIGLERNPVVRLASYAPLLARVGHSQWTPDLIYFTAEDVRLTASYYVQRAFATERGERIHAVELAGAQPFSRELPREGAAVVKSGRAAITFSDITINGEPIPDARTAPGGDGVVLAQIDPAATELEFTAVRKSGEDGFAIRLGPDHPHTFLLADFAPWQNKDATLDRFDDGIGNGESHHSWSGLTDGIPVHVRISLDGPRVQVWVDGDLHHDHTLDTRPEQRVAAGVLSRDTPGGREYLVRIVNAEDTAKTLHIALDPGSYTADVELLAGAGPEDGDLFESSPVQPVREQAKGDNGITLELGPWTFASAVIRQA